METRGIDAANRHSGRGLSSRGDHAVRIAAKRPRRMELGVSETPDFVVDWGTFCSKTATLSMSVWSVEDGLTVEDSSVVGGIPSSRFRGIPVPLPIPWQDAEGDGYDHDNGDERQRQFSTLSGFRRPVFPARRIGGDCVLVAGALNRIVFLLVSDQDFISPVDDLAGLKFWFLRGGNRSSIRGRRSPHRCGLVLLRFRP